MTDRASTTTNTSTGASRPRQRARSAQADEAGAVPAKRGPGRPRSQPLAEQRRTVLEAARQVFARHGYHGATIERVARVAGMPRPTVYELFGGKDELFIAVCDDAAERVAQRLSASLTESAEFPLRAFVRHNFAAVFDLFEQDREAVTVLLNAERGSLEPPVLAVAETRRRVLVEITALTRTRWKSLGFDIGDASEMLALMYFRMAEGVAVRQADDGDWDREALIDLLTDFTIGGLQHLWSEARDVLQAAGRRTGRDGRTPAR